MRRGRGLTGAAGSLRWGEGAGRALGAAGWRARAARGRPLESAFVVRARTEEPRAAAEHLLPETWEPRGLRARAWSAGAGPDEAPWPGPSRGRAGGTRGTGAALPRAWHRQARRARGGTARPGSRRLDSGPLLAGALPPPWSPAGQQEPRVTPVTQQVGLGWRTAGPGGGRAQGGGPVLVPRVKPSAGACVPVAARPHTPRALGAAGP